MGALFYLKLLASGVADGCYFAPERATSVVNGFRRVPPCIVLLAKVFWTSTCFPGYANCRSRRADGRNGCGAWSRIRLRRTPNSPFASSLLAPMVLVLSAATGVGQSRLVLYNPGLPRLMFFVRDQQPHLVDPLSPHCSLCCSPEDIYLQSERRRFFWLLSSARRRPCWCRLSPGVASQLSLGMWSEMHDHAGWSADAGR